MQCFQFPSSSDLIAIREAVFDVGMFAVTDFERHAWGGQSQWTHGEDPFPSRNRNDEAEAGSTSRSSGSGSRRHFGAALSAFAQCVLSGRLQGRVRTVTLDDGRTLRTTLATSTNGTVMLPLFPPLSWLSHLSDSDPTVDGSGPGGRAGFGSRSSVGGGQERLEREVEGDRSPCEAMELPAEELRASVDVVGRTYARLLDRLVHGVSSR